MDFTIIITKPIEEMLIGDTPILGEYSMPYLKGPELCNLSSNFGLTKTYRWGGSNQSRWEYMDDLLKFLNERGRVAELMSFLFKIERFEQLKGLGSFDTIQQKHKEIISGAISYINEQILLARKELRVINNRFVLSTIGEEPVIQTPKVHIISQQYIRELPSRIKDDLTNKDYDSVITKSRTLLEEVLIFIIEKLTLERYKSNGDLNKIYQEATVLLNMKQQKEWDKRINSLLGGMHKIVDAIAGMRNLNSDAHGVGSGRLTINEREAVLAANTAIILAEYWLSVYEGRTKK